MKYNQYRFLVLLSLFFVFLTSCKGPSNTGELVGVRLDKLKANKTPHGMVLIPGGTFIMNQSDEDITFSQTAQSRQVTIAPFYMDDTEISNSEYRQFVFWVRDSILIYNFLGDDSYFIDAGNGERFIDWKKVRSNSPWKTKDENSKERLSSMFYQGEDRIFGKNELDVRLLKYHFEWYDLRSATAAKNDKSKSRSDFIMRDTMLIYPDTTVWLNDFSYAQNEPMVEGYFSHPSYDEYPVVGVTWRQAQAFNTWRTRLFNNAAASNKQATRLPYQLPTEAEWEYAARGGKVGTQYPWGGPSARNARGCLMANFKPGRGNYIDDGAAYTAPVYSYWPNDFGLYNMAGNVAEWTQSSYNESAYNFVHDMNPTYNYDAKSSDPEALKRKVVRGGSWKDIGVFLQNGSRQYEYQDTAKSYIGFRSITKYPGVSTR
ncbi:SUMF1/EgtB/PvdO family nonheme iron enzyme [Sphingobacterium sp. UT-1RO-CII-1]|uniref:type IX secretion system lipoprotein PorK/GldK n=1 Tax=Sphingobacterium sp. UT-1RO-CII-1 TaxID=2995225 RepID=UPI00227CBD31|nr:SUMF1/EgtB/PvdO family nonheme iron enzyme [Sphingobacterium sp. UT-1RO-CII-1]MCY4781026.1 SUMF1/EgtB/PvdO family nonheme iron enzyme [Sphingobacterium sp. UT-1RO-CII-1]